MSQTLWRIGVDTATYEADDLSGKGAELTGGRWNAKGVAMLYTSPTRALACLETIVHLAAGGLPFNRYLVEIIVPEDVWLQADRVEPAALNVGWDAEPAGRVSIAFGTDWLKSGSSPLLLVPSVIIPDEPNVLINPAHAASRKIKARKVRKWLYDPRLRA